MKLPILVFNLNKYLCFTVLTIFFNLIIKLMHA